jgi:thymidylate synthase
MQFKNSTKAFEKLYKHIMQTGKEYDGTKAVFNTSFTIEQPRYKIIETPKRKFNTQYASFEWEWYLSGDRDASEIAEKAKIWKEMIIPGTNEVNSNYGYFWNKNKQLSRTINELKKNKHTRRAILVHYDIEELDRYKYDMPCNNVLNFYILEEKLYLTVFARSIDLVYGFCNDQYTFAKLMELIAAEIGLEIGCMNWMITNLHIYPRHFDLM